MKNTIFGKLLSKFIQFFLLTSDTRTALFMELFVEQIEFSLFHFMQKWTEYVCVCFSFTFYISNSWWFVFCIHVHFHSNVFICNDSAHDDDENTLHNQKVTITKINTNNTTNQSLRTYDTFFFFSSLVLIRLVHCFIIIIIIIRVCVFLSLSVMIGSLHVYGYFVVCLFLSLQFCALLCLSF